MSKRPTWRVTPFDGASDSLPDSWQDLNARALSAHPLADPRFLTPLLRHHASTGLHLATFEVDGACAGAALLRKSHPLRWSLFQPSQAPLGPMLLDRARIPPRDALDWLIRDLPGMPLQLELTFLDPEYSPVPDAGPGCEHVLHATTMGMRVNEPFDSYWSNRKKKLRYHLRRYQRDLEQAGIVLEFRQLTARQDMADAVNAYGDLESAGWKGQNGTAIHRDNVQGSIYRGVMDGFAADQQALVHQMLIDGRLVGCWLIIIAGGMAIMMKTTYDESMSEFALGRVHLYHALQDLFTRTDLQFIEFYTNADAAQLEWASISRPIYHLNHYRHPLWRRSRALARNLLDRLRPPPRQDAARIELPGGSCSDTLPGARRPS